MSDHATAAVPFPDSLIEQIPAKGNRPALDFIGWHHVAQRLIAEHGWEWGWEVVSVDIVRVLPDGNVWVCHGRLTVGDSQYKDGIGEGDTAKNAESDAFKRAASKWGYGLHLRGDYWLEAQLGKDADR